MIAVAPVRVEGLRMQPLQVQGAAQQNDCTSWEYWAAPVDNGTGCGCSVPRWVALLFGLLAFSGTIIGIVDYADPADNRESNGSGGPTLTGTPTESPTPHPSAAPSPVPPTYAPSPAPPTPPTYVKISTSPRYNMYYTIIE